MAWRPRLLLAWLLLVAPLVGCLGEAPDSSRQGPREPFQPVGFELETPLNESTRFTITFNQQQQGYAGDVVALLQGSHAQEERINLTGHLPVDVPVLMEAELLGSGASACELDLWLEGPPSEIQILERRNCNPSTHYDRPVRDHIQARIARSSERPIELVATTDTSSTSSLEFTIEVRTLASPHQVPPHVPVLLPTDGPANLSMQPVEEEEPYRVAVWGPGDRLVGNFERQGGPLTIELPEASTRRGYVLLLATDRQAIELDLQDGPGAPGPLLPLPSQLAYLRSHAMGSDGELDWSFETGRAPLRVGVYQAGGPHPGLDHLHVEGPDGVVLRDRDPQEDARLWLSRWGHPGLQAGTYSAGVRGIDEVNSGATFGGVLHHFLRPSSAFFADPFDDAQLPSLANASGAERDRFEILSVRAERLDRGVLEAALRVQNLSQIQVPPGYDRVVYAAAVDTGEASVMMAYEVDGEDRRFFCSEDTLVLPPEEQDPGAVTQQGIEGHRTGGRGDSRGSGSLTFELPPRCFQGSGPTLENATRLGAGTYLIQDVAGAASQVEVADEVLGQRTFPLFGAPGAASVPEPVTLVTPPRTAGDVGVPWLLLSVLGSLSVLGIAATAYVASRRREQHDRGPPVPGQPFLSKYHIESKLGAGAFGTVYLATHTNLKREVVIKQLHPQLTANQEAKARFEREARVLARLDHPHITTVHDVEEVDGTWYLIMEHVDGGSLADLLEDGPLPAEAAREIVAQVLGGLSHVHEASVLHRDIKPSNVLVTKDGVAKLADFGVARSQAAPTVAVTASGASPPGTPVYMAPEQFQGTGDDPRSDLYAVAALFHRMVTGRHHLDPPPSSYQELQQRLLEEPPAIPIDRLGLELNTWLAKGLAREPEARFQSAEEMRDALP